MIINEIRQEKLDLQTRLFEYIYGQLNDFEDKTGVQVSDVTTYFSTADGVLVEPRHFLTSVSVRLNV